MKHNLKYLTTLLFTILSSGIFSQNDIRNVLSIDPEFHVDKCSFKTTGSSKFSASGEGSSYKFNSLNDELIFNILDIQREDKIIPVIVDCNKIVPISDQEITLKGQQDIELQYIVTSEGLRQNILIGKKLPGSGLLEINMQLETSLQPLLTENEIRFYKKNNLSELVFIYNGLKVIDSRGIIIPAYFSGSENLCDNSYTYKIIVEDLDAVYPLLIDPITTTIDWSVYNFQSGSNFGAAFSRAGDINNDGYDDVVVSAYEFDGVNVDQGRVYVYFGSPVGLSFTPIQTLDGSSFNSEMGSMLAFAGDVNGDNFDDMCIVTSTGTRIYYGSSTGYTTYTGLIPGVVGDGGFPTSLSTAGDVNNDGYDDFIIGYYIADNGQTNEGVVNLFLGSSTGIVSSAYRTYQSNQVEARMGNKVTGGGDLNGDGYDDIAYSAYYYDNGNIDEGITYVHYGGPTGPGTIADWSREGNLTNGNCGYALSMGGDMNNDGYDDLALAIPGFRDSTSYEGLIEVYFGSVSGINLTNKWQYQYFRPYETGSNSCSLGLGADFNNDNYHDLIVTPAIYNYFHTGDFKIIPGAPTELIDESAFQTDLGWRDGGDVNGDGFDDIIGGDSNDSVYLSYGEPFYLASQFDEVVTENKPLTYFGHAVSSAGDVNADGFEDFIVGAHEFDSVFTNQGKVHLFLGNASGDFETPVWSYVGDQANCKFGYTVSAAGDINNDGFDDIIVGSPYYDNTYSDEGCVFIFWGGASGINDLLLPAKRYGWQLNAQFGYSVSDAGDVNNDGYADVIIGAPYYDNGSTDEGAAFVFAGNSFGLNATHLWRGESNQSNARYGYFVSGGGNINNDNYSDVAVGAPLFDKVSTDQGQVYVYKGYASGIVNTALFIKYMPGTTKFGQGLDISGDVNNDGFDDLLVASSNDFFYFQSTGVTFKSIPNWSGEGVEYVTPSGNNNRIKFIGDMNGDGYGDIAACSENTIDGSYGEGVVYLFAGNPFGITPEPIKYFGGDRTFAHLGFNAGSGDFNGDGARDFITGKSRYLQNEIYTGKVCIDFGEPAFCDEISGLFLDATTTSIIFNWDDEEVVWFNIRYRLYGTTTWTYVNSLISDFTLSGLTACQTFEFQLQSQCNFGASPWTDITTISTDCITPCAIAPTGMFINNITTTSVKANWDNMPGATSYKIWYRKIGVLSWTKKTATTNSKNLTGLTPETDYEYQIQSVCDAGTSTFSGVYTFTTLPLREDVSEIKGIKIYPNPVSSLLNIDLNEQIKNVNVRILDINGKLISNFDNTLDSEIITIDVNNFPKGVYLVIISNSTYLFKDVFIKQ